MDDLPELPFEKVLSYLSLEDRLKARAVSRRWYHQINSFRVKSLCYSNRPLDFFHKKSRWVSRAFAENLISSTRFATFFDTFGQTILSSLKHLCLCDLRLKKRDRKAFSRTLNSLSQLEELNIIWAELNQQDVLNLNLPMLKSLQIEEVDGIKKLTLEAPRLLEIKILDCDLRLEIIHVESVEMLLVDGRYTNVKKLKNLLYLYLYFNCYFWWTDSVKRIDSTSLSSLQQLKEFHTNDPQYLSELFEQQSGRADLKIYFSGLLLNGPHDPAIASFDAPAIFTFDRDFLRPKWLVCLAKNRSRLADKIPFYTTFDFRDIESVAPALEVDLLKRFTHLNEIIVHERVQPVQEIQRFLDLLKNCENISDLSFSCDQPQDLFDRLPEHCAAQSLFINRAPSDLAVLFRLKHLNDLYIADGPIDSETVRRAFGELPVLSYFEFRYDHKIASIRSVQSNQFQTSIDHKKKKTCSDLNAAIEFIFKNERP